MTEIFTIVNTGELVDSVMSVQLWCGFAGQGIVHNYVHDPTCDGKAVFHVWHNPGYDPARRLEHEDDHEGA